MAADTEGSFPTWLSSRLRDLQADDEVFSPYILSILEEEEGGDDDVLDSLADVLEGLGLDDSLPESHADSPAGFKAQIWSHWQQQLKASSGLAEVAASTAAISLDTATSNIKTQLANITEKVSL